MNRGESHHLSHEPQARYRGRMREKLKLTGSSEWYTKVAPSIRKYGGMLRKNASSFLYILDQVHFSLVSKAINWLYSSLIDFHHSWYLSYISDIGFKRDCAAATIDIIALITASWDNSVILSLTANFRALNRCWELSDLFGVAEATVVNFNGPVIQWNSSVQSDV